MAKAAASFAAEGRPSSSENRRRTPRIESSAANIFISVAFFDPPPETIISSNACFGERFESLMTDLENRVFATLPDGTWVYPGHGTDTTLGAERPHVPEWRARGW